MWCVVVCCAESKKTLDETRLKKQYMTEEITRREKIRQDEGDDWTLVEKETHDSVMAALTGEKLELQASEDLIVTMDAKTLTFEGPLLAKIADTTKELQKVQDELAERRALRERAMGEFFDREAAFARELAMKVSVAQDLLDETMAAYEGHAGSFADGIANVQRVRDRVVADALSIEDRCGVNPISLPVAHSLTSPHPPLSCPPYFAGRCWASRCTRTASGCCGKSCWPRTRSRDGRRRRR